MNTHTDDEEFREDFRNHEIALSASLEFLGQMLKERLERSYQDLLGKVIERVLAADPARRYTDDELIVAIGEYANHGRLPIPRTKRPRRTAAEKRERHRCYMAKRRAKLKASAEAEVARPDSKPPRRDWFPEAYLAYRTARRAQARAQA